VHGGSVVQLSLRLVQLVLRRLHLHVRQRLPLGLL
jgi:hypothetical protein